jgi:hypothetical protein
MHNLSTLSAWTSHEHTQTHKIHHAPNLGETTTFPLIVFSMINHGGCIQMSFCPGTPKLGVLKLSKLGLPTLWKDITSYVDLRLKWGLKQSCSRRRNLLKDMWHITFTHVFQGDSWLLVVGNQIGTLIPNPSFSHKLCFKYSNGLCKPISNI